MPIYEVEDPRTGLVLEIEGPQPPTEAQLTQIFLRTAADISNKADIPDTFSEGFGRSLADTGMRTVRGITRGIGQAINPFNIVRGAVETGKDILTNRGRGTLEGLSDVASAVASGDPDVGGEVIGNLMIGGVLPRGLPAVARRAEGVARRISGVQTRPMDVVKGLVKNMPGASMVKGIGRETEARLARRAFQEVDLPANRAAALKNVVGASRGKNVALRADELDDVLTRLRRADAPPLMVKPSLPDVGPSGAVSGPTRTGSASFGAKGDLKKWVQDRIASQESPTGASENVASIMRRRSADATPVRLPGEISPDIPLGRPASLADDAVTRYIGTDPRQPLVRELLRSEGAHGATQAGRSMLSPAELSRLERIIQPASAHTPLSPREIAAARAQERFGRRFRME